MHLTAPRATATFPAKRRARLSASRAACNVTLRTNHDAADCIFVGFNHVELRGKVGSRRIPDGRVSLIGREKVRGVAQRSG